MRPAAVEIRTGPFRAPTGLGPEATWRPVTILLIVAIVGMLSVPIYARSMPTFDQGPSARHRRTDPSPVAY